LSIGDGFVRQFYMQNNKKTFEAAEAEQRARESGRALPYTAGKVFKELVRRPKREGLAPSKRATK